MQSTSKEAQSLIINILLFFYERDRASVWGGGDDSLFTCYECNIHRNNYDERNICHKTRKNQYSQIEAIGPFKEYGKRIQ